MQDFTLLNHHPRGRKQDDGMWLLRIAQSAAGLTGLALLRMLMETL